MTVSVGFLLAVCGVSLIRGWLSQLSVSQATELFQWTMNNEPERHLYIWRMSMRGRGISRFARILVQISNGHNSLPSWPQFSHHEADQVTTRCIKCRMPGQTSTNTLSSQQLYVCRMHYHRPPVHDTRPSRTALYWKMKMNSKTVR